MMTMIIPVMKLPMTQTIQIPMMMMEMAMMRNRKTVTMNATRTMIEV